MAALSTIYVDCTLARKRDNGFGKQEVRTGLSLLGPRKVKSDTVVFTVIIRQSERNMNKLLQMCIWWRDTRFTDTNLSNVTFY